ncbi:MAG: hypothetical protein N3F64_02355 [Nitrososphaeria archaeon]|nr:hypothetical protein [Nitrososphaeria archaeon]
MVYEKIGCGRRAVVQTTAVLIVFVILFSCTLTILNVERHIINYYLVRENVLATRGKVMECKINAAIKLLEYIDDIMLSRKLLSYEEFMDIFDDKIFYESYKDEVFSVSFFVHFSLKGFSENRLHGFPEYSGSRFYAKINYHIVNRFDVEVYGEDTFYVTCNVDFTSILDRVRVAQNIFENQMVSKLSFNSTLDEIVNLVYELNGLLKDCSGCSIVLDYVSFGDSNLMIGYKIVYPISYESVLKYGVSNMVSLYCERLLIL